ncbi:unnamed protein product [Rotaria sp. Silwood2]|nr:unnamed protein product [Rotaria sp. Silwood2]CAF3054625.1 unnamed protein product [Rotaria sp. Silwood2]CAF3113737.1 unnamed protein product [Rotaria sp. Silwood2]CAF4048655.1 unnamed protein product [Rotaria sp. Silwood2]CAF4272816.1 unnamed protein product [Rotaria sp. Silwood2]
MPVCYPYDRYLTHPCPELPTTASAIRNNSRNDTVQQFQQHNHLFTAPVALVSKHMKSTNDVWLFLIGYFISFLLPMLTFIVFILPSESYKEQLRKTITAYRRKI